MKFGIDAFPSHALIFFRLLPTLFSPIDYHYHLYSHSYAVYSILLESLISEDE